MVSTLSLKEKDSVSSTLLFLFVFILNNQIGFSYLHTCIFIRGARVLTATHKKTYLMI